MADEGGHEGGVMATSRFLLGGVASALLLTGGVFLWLSLIHILACRSRARLRRVRAANWYWRTARAAGSTRRLCCRLWRKTALGWGAAIQLSYASIETEISDAAIFPSKP